MFCIIKQHKTGFWTGNVTDTGMKLEAVHIQVTNALMLNIKWKPLPVFRYISESAGVLVVFSGSMKVSFSYVLTGVLTEEPQFSSTRL